MPHLSLSYARHTNTINQTFVLLSSDYSKSLHLQTDRFLEFHTPGGLHYSTRIPRYGRDLKYNRRTAEALVPAVGVNLDGYGEVYRLNLDAGRFMKGYEVDVGGDDFNSLGGGALQGGIRAGAVNCAAVAEESHGLMAFGTSLGTVEFWDSRSRNRVSALGPPTSVLDTGQDIRPAVTALEFHPSGLQLATGTDTGLIHTYDMRSSVPLLRKSQGYDAPIQTLKYLISSSSSRNAISAERLLSSDRKSIKLYDTASGDLWTSVEPAVDLNCVEWVPDSGMLLTANEGRQQHAFFMPSLGPAPRWCSFLDNLVEEMAEDTEGDPSAFNAAKAGAAGEVYDNYKFVSSAQLVELSLDHLLSSTNILRPYMHGYFVPQRLYEQARLLTNPDLALEQRQKSIQEKIDKERESRIRGNKKTAVKVNRKLAEKLAAREEANERRKADRLLRKAERNGEPMEDTQKSTDANEDSQSKSARAGLMEDDRFKRLFEDADFEIDENSREFAMQNPSSVPTTNNVDELKKRGRTAVEAEEDDSAAGSSDSDEDDDEDAQAEEQALRARQRHGDDSREERGKGRIGNANYKKSGHRPKVQMQVSSSRPQDRPRARQKQSQSFGDMASSIPSRSRSNGGGGDRGDAVGAKEITFAPSSGKKGKGPKAGGDLGGDGGRKVGRGKVEKSRRSASGNVMRGL